ncbi:hypothetical protein ES332_D05G355700v1 [Gossypium tomentosum]|uniref:MADS-box domain-containing protein n=1 Tax=Gossypium tomentosum TaxID=34277 RepID=A0A5D2L3C9_GOSTO|nr:hypothetical protein ES332_D05G355700v1 [Gossypium tomentosum]
MQQTIKRYRRHTKDNETNKPIEQNLQHLKAESANMLKIVEDLKVSRRYCLRSTSQALFLHLETSMLLETKDVELASLSVQSASS